MALDIPHWKRTSGPEWQRSEQPLLQQLADMGWDILLLPGKGEGAQHPADSGRESFRQPILPDKLREGLLKKQPWLEDDQIKQVVGTITRYAHTKLLENNEAVLDLLLSNTTVDENRQTGQRNPSVFYIDFDEPGNNVYTAVSQLQVQQRDGTGFFYPDVTLFVNGLPVAVVECKADKYDADSIGKAIDQLMRYSGQGPYENANSGNPELFYYNQILVVTCRNIAKFGTVSTHREKHFYRWTDPYPLKLDDLDHKYKATNDQYRLVAGMFAHRNLLDLIRSYTIFQDVGKQRIKIVGRYQQFRAVKLALKRLREGKNAKERQGIIWHTQGSGKSLTMMFLVREMKRDPKLREWKTVFVTDRTDLEKQLSGTAQAIGSTVKVADRIKKLEEYLPTDSSDIVMAMIHKFQERDEANSVNLHKLNESEKILVMTDEAHRTQYSALRAQLDAALPNATHIGFTGTPIDKTEKVYGDYIDKYTMRQAIDDGVTLEIVYEGRTHKAGIADRDAMNQAFLDVFPSYPAYEGDNDEDPGYDAHEQSEILLNGKRATRDAYLEARETIKAKAADMVEHYASHVFPNGFKGQVVAHSRLACVRYKEALEEALAEKVASLKASNPDRIDIERLKALEVGVVISGAADDDQTLKAHTVSREHDALIKRFKLGFDESDDAGAGTVGILVVNNMLLTGFDAPIEQVMYLDRVIVAHNLLQAIARVNRVGPAHKAKGYVVDYVGVGHHLKKALDVYDELERNEALGALSNPKKGIEELEHAYKEMKDFLQRNRLTDLDDLDAFYDCFYDEELRFEFVSLYKELSKAIDVVLPGKEALNYLDDFKKLTAINVQASKHTRDERMGIHDLSGKLRAIMDDYLASEGIDQKVPPLSIMDQSFMSEVTAKKRAKTKAAEIEHAIRNYLEEHLDEDPALYASFAEMLEEILKKFQDNWEEVYAELKSLLEKLQNAERESHYGLDRKSQMPFFRTLKANLVEEEEPTEEQIGKLVNMTLEVVELLKREMGIRGFWEAHRGADQGRLRGEVKKLLIDYSSSFPKAMKARDAIASEIMTSARANNDYILYA